MDSGSSLLTRLRLACSHVLMRILSRIAKSRNTFVASPGRNPEVIDLNDLSCLVKARHGWFLVNRYDFYLGYAVIRYGEYNELESRFLCSLVEEGDVVIEVGANIGTHTVPLARRIGARGRLIAIEPQPIIYQQLCANVALNALLNVATHNCGCGAKRQTMRIATVDYGSRVMQNFGGISLQQGGSGVPIDVVPLDDLVGQLPGLRLIKIDVEGMEGEVLKGAERLIRRYRPRLYVENDRVEKSQALIELLMSHGYRLWWHKPPLFNPDNYFGLTHNEYPNVVSLNMICLPKEDAMIVRGHEILDSAEHPIRR